MDEWWHKATMKHSDKVKVRPSRTRRPPAPWPRIPTAASAGASAAHGSDRSPEALGGRRGAGNAEPHPEGCPVAVAAPSGASAAAQGRGARSSAGAQETPAAAVARPPRDSRGLPSRTCRKAVQRKVRCVWSFSGPHFESEYKAPIFVQGPTPNTIMVAECQVTGLSLVVKGKRES